MSVSTLKPRSNLTITHFQACITYHIQLPHGEVDMGLIRGGVSQREAGCCFEGKREKWWIQGLRKLDSESLVYGKIKKQSFLKF